MLRFPRETIQYQQIESFINDALSPDEIVDKKIFLVRHGECEDEVKTEYDVNKQKGSTSPLTAKGRQQIEETANYLINILQDPTNTLAIEDNANNSARIEESSAIIKRIVGCTKVLDDKKLDSLPAYGENDQMEAKLLGGAIHAEYYKQFKERLKNEYKKEIKNILLTVHKSAISNLENLFINKEMGFVTSYDYKHGEIREWDYNKKGRIINKYEKKDILQINQGNIDEIIGILETDEVITQNNEVNLRTMDIIQLQNFVNACFREYRKLHTKYICSDNKDLRIICLATILNNISKLQRIASNISELQKMVQNISEYTQGCQEYMDFKGKISQEEKEILLSKLDIPEIKELVIAHFVTRRELRDEEESKLFISLKLNDFYKELQERRTTYEKTVEIQQRSLDKFIVNQYPNAILERKIYTVEKLKEEDEPGITGGENKNKYKKINISIQEIIAGLKAGKHYVLPAHVGIGKSIWLSKLIKQSVIDSEASILYLEGKDFIKENVSFSRKFEWTENRRTREYRGGNNRGIICIDAIDEIKNNRSKQSIKKDMGSSSSGWKKLGLIITGRLSEYNERENEGFITLGMENIPKEEFIKNKISDPDKVAMVLEKLEQSDLSEEIEGNPLLLNFVCMLANEHNTFDDIEIKSIEHIKNKADLYENIVKLILYKHEGGKSQYYSGNAGKTRLYNDMQLLGKFAYILYTGGNIDDFGKDSPLRDEDNFKRFSILFKKTEDNTYGFIHKSFEEFFAVKEILKVLGNKEGKEGEEYLTSMIFENIAKIDYSALKFFVDVINNDSNKHVKDMVLNYIMNNRYRIGIAQAKIIYIVYMLDNNLFKKYTSTIKFDNNTLFEIIYNNYFIHTPGYIDFLKSLKDNEDLQSTVALLRALGRIGGEENIEYIKSFKNNEDVLIRAKVIEVLGNIGGKENIEIIKAFKNDKETAIRGQMVKILGKIGGEENIEFIKKLRYTEKSEVKIEIVKVLGEIGGEENINCIKSLIHERKIKEKIIKILGDIGGEENGDFIRSLKKDNNVQIIFETIIVLGKIGGEENINFIKSFRNNKNTRIVEKVIEIVGNDGGEANIEFIKSFKNDKRWNIKEAMIKTLGKIGGEKNIEFIKSFKNDEGRGIKGAIIETLGKIGGKENIEFIKTFKDDESLKWTIIDTLWRGEKDNNFITFIKSFKDDKDDILRANIMRIIEKIGGEDNITFLKSFKDDKNPEIRLQTVETVGRIGGKENIKFITSFKKSKNSKIRQSIIDILRRHGGKENIKHIKSFKNDKNHSIRRTVMSTLCSIGGKENIEFIKTFRNDKKSNIRKNLILQLGEIGGEENIEFIKSFQDDESNEVKAKMIQTLLQIGGKENLRFIRSFLNNNNRHIKKRLIESLSYYGWKENIPLIEFLNTI